MTWQQLRQQSQSPARFKDVARRLKYLLKNDHHIRDSGFKIMTRRDCLLWRTGENSESQLSREKAILPTRQTEGVANEFFGQNFTTMIRSSSKPLRQATCGGFVLVGEKFCILTVARIFQQHNFQQTTMETSNHDELGSVFSLTGN